MDRQSNCQDINNIAISIVYKNEKWSYSHKYENITTSMKNDDIAAILIHPIFKGVDFFVGSCVGVCKGDLI